MKSVIKKTGAGTSNRLRTKMDETLVLPDLGNWEDPFPAPRVEKVGKFYVVRDYLLEYGSKIRFLDYFVSTSDEKEFVYGG